VTREYTHGEAHISARVNHVHYEVINYYVWLPGYLVWHCNFSPPTNSNLCIHFAWAL